MPGARSVIVVIDNESPDSALVFAVPICCELLIMSFLLLVGPILGDITCNMGSSAPGTSLFPITTSQASLLG